ncbi:MAG: response regulator [Eubacteriales bacterium]|nr:response regulator [Eubacteriales bacterium]
MLKILVVEDEIYARESLIKQIREYDAQGQFTILQAANGEEGIALYQKQRPDLVMTDVRMPKIDGLRLLEKIRETDDRTQVVIISAYSDFEYARKALANGAVDYLLKPVENEALYHCLDKIVQRDRSEKKEVLVTGRDIVTRMILDSIRQEKHLTFVEKNMFQKIFPSYQITTLKFRNKMPDQEELLTGIEQVCGNSFWTQLRFLELDAGIWGLMVCPDTENTFFQRKIRRQMENYGYTVSMGVGGVHRKPEEIRDAYLEAVDALKYKIYGESITFSERLKEAVPEYHFSKEKEMALQDALQERNEKKTEESIRALFHEISEMGFVNAESLEVLYSKITLLFLQNLGENTQRRESIGEIQKGILRFETLLDMEVFLVNIGRNICRMSRNSDKKNKRDVVEVMADYAKEHYGQDVSVKILAEQVLFMNQDYLSHLFAEKKGISFSAFLRGIRMDKAKELLENENYSVTEVASMTGYNDTSQFIRVFKQETGKTPKKYKDSKNERKNG